MANVIETFELTKHYGMLFWKSKYPALNKLTIAIPEGAIFGFLGPNGAGKTTTIKLLMDLIKPTGGEMKIFGMSPENTEVKKMLGFLPDNPAFSSYMSAYEFLNICAKLLRIPALERRDRIEEVLKIVKMEKCSNQKLGGFSRGMTQRIGIAQAILNKPKLLVLDEPLTGLDPHGRQELTEIMLNQKARGTTVFFSSHILSDVEKISDYVGILNKGILLCCGRLEELLSETGTRAHVSPHKEEVVKDIMTYSSGSIRLPDGSWELVFQKNNEVMEKLRRLRDQFPDSITLTPTRESLEEFFFRKVETSVEIS